jgi:hypothetical protein
LPRLKSSNNASSTLSAAILSTDTSLVVVDSSSFPIAPFRITINAEVIEVGAIDKTTHTLSSLLRGQEGTTATSHASGDAVQNRFTAGTHDELVDITEVEKKIHRATTAPSDTTLLWLDTSVTPNILKRYDGTIWIKATPTLASEVGAASKTDFDAHLAENMPHKFTDATDLKTYRYGFKTNNAKDGLVFVYQEVL